jgi:hypothetical protein
MEEVGTRGLAGRGRRKHGPALAAYVEKGWGKRRYKKGTFVFG